jgi:hypothetical protein
LSFPHDYKSEEELDEEHEEDYAYKCLESDDCIERLVQVNLQNQQSCEA